MHQDAGSSEHEDLVATLAARIDDLAAQLRTTAAAVDEKSLKEFRRTVESLSKRDEKFEERVTNKVGVVADRLETLARTVSTTSAALAAKDGEIAQLRRDLDVGGARIESALAEARRAHDPVALTEIRRTVAEISKQKLPRGLEDRIEELGSKLTMLAQRIDTVSSTVSTTASGLAGRDGDLIAFRRAYEAESDRINAELAELRRAFDPTPVTELRQAVVELRERTADHRRSVQLVVDDASVKADALATRVDTLAASIASTSARVSGAEEQLSALRAHLEEGGVHLNSLAAAVAAASERLDARDVELEALERRFHEASARVDGLVGELSRALNDFPNPASTEQLLEVRLSELDRVRTSDRVRIEDVADRLESTLATVESLAEHAPESEEVGRLLEDLVARVDASDDDRAGTSTEVARLAAILEVERAGVRSKLESLAATQQSLTGSVSVEELEQSVAGFAGRVDAIEHDREALITRVSRLASAFDAERASFQTQLEALAAALSWTSPRSSVDERLDAFDQRLHDIERASAAVASKVSQATTLLPAALRSLEARLDELAPRLGETETSDPLPRAHSPSPSLVAEPSAGYAEDGDSAAQRLPSAAIPRLGTDP